MSIVARNAKAQREMERLCLELIDEADIPSIIRRLRHSVLSDSERLWVMYKVSQIQAGRNIIAVAENGLNTMGVGR